MTKLKHKKEAYKKWKRDQVIQEEYRDTVRACTCGVREAKAHLQLNMLRDMKGKKEGFYRSISSKRKTRGNTGLLLNRAGELVTKSTEKA